MALGLSQRLSITGMGGLALLFATHWMRKNVSGPAPALAFALGVLPNLAFAWQEARPRDPPTGPQEKAPDLPRI